MSTCLKNITLFGDQGLIVFYWFRSEVLVDFYSNVNFFLVFRLFCQCVFMQYQKICTGGSYLCTCVYCGQLTFLFKFMWYGVFTVLCLYSLMLLLNSLCWSMYFIWLSYFENTLATWNFYRSLFHACHTIAFKICYTFTVFSMWCNILKAALCCWLKCSYFQLAVNLEKVGKLCSWRITTPASELCFCV